MMNSLFERIAAALGCIPDNADVITACQILESNGVGVFFGWLGGLIGQTIWRRAANFGHLVGIFRYFLSYLLQYGLTEAIWGIVDPRLRGDDSIGKLGEIWLE